MNSYAFPVRRGTKSVDAEVRLIHPVTTVLTTSEFKWLEERAKAMDTSKSKLVREAIMMLMGDGEE